MAANRDGFRSLYLYIPNPRIAHAVQMDNKYKLSKLSEEINYFISKYGDVDVELFVKDGICCPCNKIRFSHFDYERNMLVFIKTE